MRGAPAVAIVPGDMPWARLVSVACALLAACSKSDPEGIAPPTGAAVRALALPVALSRRDDIRSVPRCPLVSPEHGLVPTFEALLEIAPSGYPNWASIARDGADAARAEDLDAVKSACRSCHAQYGERYRRERSAGPR
jgi:hypothetical protein